MHGHVLRGAELSPRPTGRQRGSAALFQSRIWELASARALSPASLRSFVRFCPCLLRRGVFSGPREHLLLERSLLSSRSETRHHLSTSILPPAAQRGDRTRVLGGSGWDELGQRVIQVCRRARHVPRVRLITARSWGSFDVRQNFSSFC